MRPSQVLVVKPEACHWQACIYTADDALLDVTLVFEGRTHRKKRVPLCGPHMQVFRETGRVNVRPEYLFEVEKR